MSHWRPKKVPLLIQQLHLGVPMFGETRCKCRTNVNYGGGRQLDHALECYNKDEDFACRVRLLGRGAQVWDTVPSETSVRSRPS